ncbi:MAG: glycosyltransferase family 2 protein [Bacteroidales bacterium]|nr:glycosyltransferase family 2 protein [Bacteroidales bacterium]
MDKLHIITPVKDSLDTTLQTIKSILNSQTDVCFNYTIYNDFSTQVTTQRLEKEAAEKGFKLVHLKDITMNESPNYLPVLQLAQAQAIQDNAHLIIVESDVVVAQSTIEILYQYSQKHPDAGLIASVTNDEEGNVNFPYLYAKNYEKKAIDTKKRLSFCCTLITNKFLNAYDFKLLDTKKSWYDIHISRQSRKLGFKNYLLMNLPVLHIPHSSRPWKKLKYTNPIRYYFSKYFVKNKDKF